MQNETSIPMHVNETECPFCNSDINELAFLESEKFLATYNIAPVFPGHSLIIPKAHITSLFDLSDEDLFEFIKFSRRAIKILSLAFNTEGFNWILQEREEAGQTVAHMHIHILPRKPGDIEHPGDWYPKMKYNINDVIDSDKRKKLNQDEIKRIIGKLRSVSDKL
jgi:bis(5'-adenosyl)-triphosphatase